MTRVDNANVNGFFVRPRRSDVPAWAIGVDRRGVDWESIISGRTDPRCPVAQRAATPPPLQPRLAHAFVVAFDP
jgi:hypothetical protein